MLILNSLLIPRGDVPPNPLQFPSIPSHHTHSEKLDNATQDIKRIKETTKPSTTPIVCMNNNKEVKWELEVVILPNGEPSSFYTPFFATVTYLTKHRLVNSIHVNFLKNIK